MSGSSVVGLVEGVIRSQNQFTPLQGQAVDASLQYGGIANAIQFQRNAAGTSATVTIPSTGFTRRPPAPIERDVMTQIEDFLIKEGLTKYARSLAPVNEQSVIGVVDGNPQAATAQLSNSAFFKFGLQRSPLTAGALASSTGFGSGLRLDLTGGLVNTDVADGLYVTGPSSSVRALATASASLRQPLHVSRGRRRQSVHGRAGVRWLPIVSSSRS